MVKSVAIRSSDDIRRNQQVEVVVHQNERVQHNAMIAASSAEQAPEMVAVVRIEKDRAPVDAALRDMRRDTWQFQTRQSWHGSGC